MADLGVYPTGAGAGGVVEPSGCWWDRCGRTRVVTVLVEPAPALTDLLLGIVVLGLAVGLRRTPAVNRYWRGAFWWAGIGAIGGFVHHGVLVRWPAVASVS